jgi:arginine N-succinyltransferase
MTEIPGTAAPRYEIRAATREDHGDLLTLARYLDSVNLPNDPKVIEHILEQSEKSFSGEIASPKRREWVFVLRDLEEGRAVGTSMIIGQLGRRDAPYVYFDVHTEERYSQTLDRHFAHQVLTIGYSYDGPTEIGGLVVHPDVRRSTERLGMLISYVRFLWIAMHRDLVRPTLLAELLPPLESDGTSHLWEAVGRHFTGLTYREADRLSKKNKEFVRGLFPDGNIYTSLLSPEAQSVIGKVGPQTRGVEKLLRRIGFRYADRVDPFDGGPHFVAPVDEVSLVARSRAGRIRVGSPAPGARALVAVESPGKPFFRCVPTLAALEGGEVVVPRGTAGWLGVLDGAPAIALPLDERARSPENSK